VRSLVAALLIVFSASSPAWAMTALFYQPQLRDLRVAESDWPKIFDDVRTFGFDTLVLQWTRHGRSFADGAERQWLESRVQQARAAGLRIIVGLAADPSFFDRVAQSREALGVYLRRLTIDDVALAERWAKTLPPEVIAGWYLPAEIDDQHWRDSGRAQTLSAHLSASVVGLEAILARPVYTSSFFTGKMHPQRYFELIASLRKTGVRLWVQDGRGTGVLLEDERQLYLKPLLDCANTPIDALIYELFVQERSSKTFAATGIGAARTKQLLDAASPCRGRRVFFELRYLPGIDQRMGAARSQGD
jgi:hypothetical protein